jgi:hypothetical protein
MTKFVNESGKYDTPSAHIVEWNHNDVSTAAQTFNLQTDIDIQFNQPVVNGPATIILSVGSSGTPQFDAIVASFTNGTMNYGQYLGIDTGGGEIIQNMGMSSGPEHHVAYLYCYNNDISTATQTVAKYKIEVHIQYQNDNENRVYRIIVDKIE